MVLLFENQKGLLKLRFWLNYEYTVSKSRFWIHRLPSPSLNNTHSGPRAWCTPPPPPPFFWKPKRAIKVKILVELGVLSQDFESIGPTLFFKQSWAWCTPFIIFSFIKSSRIDIDKYWLFILFFIIWLCVLIRDLW